MNEIANGIVEAMEAMVAKAKDAPAPRKSRISKTVERTIPTAAYENVKITTHLEIDVEWEDPKELMQKSEKFNKLVIEDYKRTEAQVMQELNLAEKRAYPNDQLKQRLATTTAEGFDSLN